MTQTRQLAAIMFTDIVGYTALMGKDEKKAFEFLQRNRELQKPVIKLYHGRLIKELGDGTMASFNTITNAVTAAIKIIEACDLARDFKLRIGIHLGEVVFENNDVFGDGVNIASRIQAAAKPGSIYISETVNTNLSNKKDFQTRYVKEETLKNVKEPIKLYEVITSNSPRFISTHQNENHQNSIAVLPFINMSSDPEQEFFSDGISEEIMNMLAQVSELKVAGRTSSFSFKGKNQDIRLIGEQLNVQHILEGSVRKSGNRLRITAQLIKVEDGYHEWSEKFDRELADVFDIQDEISLAILNAIKIRLLSSEKIAILKRGTNNHEAYQLYLQGRFHYNKWAGADGYKKAIEYYIQALTLEPLYVLSYTGLAACYLNLWFFNHLPRELSLEKMKEAVAQAIELDPDIAESHLVIARMKFWYEWDFAAAELEFLRAIELNSNLAEAHEQYGMMLGILKRKEEALQQADIALMLDPFSLMIHWGAGWINWMLGIYNRSIELGKKLIEFEYYFFGGHLILGSSYLFMGKYIEALAETKIAAELNYGSFTLFHLGLIYGVAGEKEKARALLDELLNLRKTSQVGNYDLAMVYASTGDNEKAVSCLEEGLETHEGMMVFLRLHSQLIPWFKSNPKLEHIVTEVGV